MEVPEDILYFENGIKEAEEFFNQNIFFGSYEVVMTVKGGVRIDELNDFTSLLTEKFGRFSHIHMVFDNIDDATRPCRITILTCPKGPNYSGFTEDKEDDFEE